MANKKTSALAKLRILIREEVKNAIREEMPVLIMEALAKQNRLIESKIKQGSINPQDKKIIKEKLRFVNVLYVVMILKLLNIYPINM